MYCFVFINLEIPHFKDSFGKGTQQFKKKTTSLGYEKQFSFQTVHYEGLPRRKHSFEVTEPSANHEKYTKQKQYPKKHM